LFINWKNKGLQYHYGVLLHSDRAIITRFCTKCYRSSIAKQKNALALMFYYVYNSTILRVIPNLTLPCGVSTLRLQPSNFEQYWVKWKNTNFRIKL